MQILCKEPNGDDTASVEWNSFRFSSAVCLPLCLETCLMGAPTECICDLPLFFFQWPEHKIPFMLDVLRETLPTKQDGHNWRILIQTGSNDCILLPVGEMLVLFRVLCIKVWKCDHLRLRKKSRSVLLNFSPVGDRDKWTRKRSLQ